MLLVIVIFILILSGGLNIYALKKASDVCKKVKIIQPDFLTQKARYNFMIKRDDSQFMLYILSGAYKKLNDLSLIKICRRIKQTYIISALAFFILAISLIIYLHLMSSLQ